MRLITEVKRIITEAVKLTDLKDAILSQKVIQFNYEGKEGIRKVEPVLIGKTKKNNTAIRAYQINGATSTQNNEWKIFLTDKMSNLKVLELDQAENRPEYNPNGDAEFRKIVIQRPT